MNHLRFLNDFFHPADYFGGFLKENQFIFTNLMRKNKELSLAHFFWPALAGKINRISLFNAPRLSFEIFQFRHIFPGSRLNND